MILRIDIFRVKKILETLNKVIADFLTQHESKEIDAILTQLSDLNLKLATLAPALLKSVNRLLKESPNEDGEFLWFLPSHLLSIINDREDCFMQSNLMQSAIAHLSKVEEAIIGTVQDGEARRFILKRLGTYKHRLEDIVEEGSSEYCIMKRNPMVASSLSESARSETEQIQLLQTSQDLKIAKKEDLEALRAQTITGNNQQDTVPTLTSIMGYFKSAANGLLFGKKTINRHSTQAKQAPVFIV